MFEENGSEEGAGRRDTGVEPVVSPAVIMSKDDKDKDVVVGSFSRQNKLGRRSFSRYVKAVLFETSLLKKMRNQKSRQKLHRNHNRDKSKPTQIFYSKSVNNISSMNTDHNQSTSSSTSSSSLFSTSTTTNSLSSSSASSTTASRCLSLSERNNMQAKVRNHGDGKGCNGLNVGICSILISLLVLVIWGKICAIFCTSAWLFFAYRWNTIKLVPSENIAAGHRFVDIDTELYKKKVIMEGLLERNHSRNPSFALMKPVRIHKQD
ncbi:hypothetical protein DITRI_Ditri14bG0123700 [Diplodiscus trichospermus]